MHTHVSMYIHMLIHFSIVLVTVDGTTFAFTFSSVIWTLKLKPSDTCVRIEWKGETSHQIPLRDCFNMSESTWYGGYETYNQQWPIDTNSSRKMMPFLSNNTYKHQDGFGPVIHPVWLSSNGVVLFVDKEVPLHVSMDQGNRLCLQSVPYALGCTPEAAQEGALLYTVCQFSDIVAATNYFLQDSRHIPKPTTLPDLEVFRRPIWSTGIYFGVDINEANICGYANRIVNAPLPISKLGIDSGYSRKYGDFDVNAAKFPNGFENIANFAQANKFNLTAWVHPFVNYDTQAFKMEMQNRSGIFLPGGSRETTALVEWWKGHGALVNFEMDAARDWFSDKIARFVHNNCLDSLRFDAGESEYLPDCLYFPDSSHPATYTQEYINLVSNFSFSTSAEVRVGYFSQDKPIFVRMSMRSSTWGLDSGLHSVLTTALTMSLIGYNYIIPDVIGGNGECHNQRLKNQCNTAGGQCKQMNINCSTTFCEDTELQKELYIRWMQMAAFLPVMHFSIPPWAFNSNEIVTYAKSLVDFHSWFVDECIIPLLKDMVTNGVSPLVRAVWWLDPKNKEALNIDDQFVIGNTILVAPITKPHQVSRVGYLPPGTWKKCKTSGSNQPNCDANKQYSDRFEIQIPLTDEMVYFKRIDQTDGIC